MGAFEEMRKIDLRNASIALYIDPKLRDLKEERKINVGEFSFPIGQAFSAKLIKALAYNFRTIYILDEPIYKGTDHVNAVMNVSLQDADMNIGVAPGFAKVSANSYARLAIRAEIQDAGEKKIVWVGTTQAKESASYEELGKMSYQEAGRGFAMAMDSVVDKAIGDIIQQMSKSQSLQTYLVKWELNNKGLLNAQK